VVFELGSFRGDVGGGVEVEGEEGGGIVVLVVGGFADVLGGDREIEGVVHCDGGLFGCGEVFGKLVYYET
jgi:hypothetical protein